jgi:hypothetical protein
MTSVVSVRRTLKPVLKRGALVAAANWPVIMIESIADSLFKLLIAAPLLGGIFLAALVVGAEPGAMLTLEWRELAATIVTSLFAHPLVLVAFLLALAVVIVGGSLFVFLMKAGTVGVLVRGEREAGPVELPPLHFDVVASAAKFSIELFVESARALFPRYAQLGFVLMGVYLLSGAIYVVVIFAGRGSTDGWMLPAFLTAVFVTWITIVNLVYLLVQLVIAADDCAVMTAVRRVLAFTRYERRSVVAVFLVVLVVVVFATGASLLATAALGLIAFIPFIGLTVLPLQLLAWVLRGLVFQYIGLSSIGAYLKLYREYTGNLATRSALGRFGSAVDDRRPGLAL